MRTEISKYKDGGNDVYIDHGQLSALKQGFLDDAQNCKKESEGLLELIRRVENHQVRKILENYYYECDKRTKRMVKYSSEIANSCQNVIDEFTNADKKLYYFLNNMVPGELRESWH